MSIEKNWVSASSILPGGGGTSFISDGDGGGDVHSLCGGHSQLPPL